MNGTAIAFTRPPVRRVQCIVCDILAELDPETSAAARGALAESMKVWPHTTIAKTFTDLGHVVSGHSVSTHRLRCS